MGLWVCDHIILMKWKHCEGITALTQLLLLQIHIQYILFEKFSAEQETPLCAI